MSIVYDYLKKIHDQKEPQKSSATSETAPVKKSSHSSFWGKIMAGVLGCLLLGAGLYFFLPRVLKTAIKPAAVPEKPRVVRPETPDFAFLLEGIIYNPSKPFAIIDGKMFEVGGQVGDFEVTKITPDTISLKNLKDGTSRTVHL